MSRATLVVLLLVVPTFAAAQSAEVPATPWGHPDLQGIWDQTTGTPLERPDDSGEREFLPEEEAVEREAQRFQAFDEAPRPGSAGNYGSQ